MIVDLFSLAEQLTLYVYPSLGFACLASAFVITLTYITWDRTFVLLPIAVHFLVEAVSFLLYTLTLGHNPSLDRDFVRACLVWLRFYLFLNCCAVIYWQIHRFGERKEKKQ